MWRKPAVGRFTYWVAPSCAIFFPRVLLLPRIQSGIQNEDCETPGVGLLSTFYDF